MPEKKESGKERERDESQQNSRILAALQIPQQSDGRLHDNNIQTKAQEEDNGTRLDRNVADIQLHNYV